MKKPLLIAIITSLGILGAFTFLTRVSPLQSASGDNVSGYIWSPNVGWTKLSGPNYGLNFDFADSNGDGFFDSASLSAGRQYAWNSNIGWIDMNPGGPYPSAPAHGVRFVNNNLEGWARATNNGQGWDGWIKFGGTNYSSTRNGCTFDGYAWGSNLIGWIKTSGPNYGFTLSPSTGCELAAVTNMASNNNPITDAGATISWQSSSNVYGYEVVNEWPGGPSAGTIITGTSQGVTPPDRQGGLATFLLRSINRFGDKGPIAQLQVPVDYPYRVTCEVNPPTTDFRSPVQIRATAANGTGNNQYTLEAQGGFSFTTDSALTQSSPNARTWDNVLITDENLAVGQRIFTVRAQDNAGEVATTTCPLVTDFGDRFLEEVSP